MDDLDPLDEGLSCKSLDLRVNQRWSNRLGEFHIIGITSGAKSSHKANTRSDTPLSVNLLAI